MSHKPNQIQQQTPWDRLPLSTTHKHKNRYAKTYVSIRKCFTLISSQYVCVFAFFIDFQLVCEFYELCYSRLFTMSAISTVRKICISWWSRLFSHLIVIKTFSDLTERSINPVFPYLWSELWYIFSQNIQYLACLFFFSVAFFKNMYFVFTWNLHIFVMEDTWFGSAYHVIKPLFNILILTIHPAVFCWWKLSGPGGFVVSVSLLLLFYFPSY